jgi:hypothetical protein
MKQDRVMALEKDGHSPKGRRQTKATKANAAARQSRQKSNRQWMGCHKP